MLFLAFLWFGVAFFLFLGFVFKDGVLPGCGCLYFLDVVVQSFGGVLDCYGLYSGC